MGWLVVCSLNPKAATGEKWKQVVQFNDIWYSTHSGWPKWKAIRGFDTVAEVF